MKTELIDNIIDSAGYGISLPSDKKEQFLMRRLVEHSYSEGVKNGIDSGKQLNTIVENWINDNKYK